MPCSDSNAWAEQLRREKERTDTEYLVRMSTLLCSACSVLQRYDYNFAENPLLDEWWHRHKKFDASKKQA